MSYDYGRLGRHVLVSFFSMLTFLLVKIAVIVIVFLPLSSLLLTAVVTVVLSPLVLYCQPENKTRMYTMPDY